MFSFLKKHYFIMSAVIVVVIFIAVVASRSNSKQIDSNPDSNLRAVTLVPAITLRSDASVVAADGIIESAAQAELRSQISAPVTSVLVSIGDWVNAGDTLLTLQNADIRAQLDQAEANLSLAKAQYSNAGISIDSANKSVVDKIQDSYLKVDDSIHTQIDQLFSNPKSNNPQLLFATSNQQLVVDIQSERLAMESSLASWKQSLASMKDNISDAELDSAIALAYKNLDDAKKILNNISDALNIAIPSPVVSVNLANWKIAVSTARANISGGVIGLTAADSILINARAILRNPDNKGLDSISVGQAQIQAAEAVVNNLKVQLSKTIIKTPISGKIGSMTVKVGELVSPSQIVASVVNTTGLEIKAFVSDVDSSKIVYGLPALIEEKIKGVVTKISPSIDQSSKKVEIKIVVADSSSSGLVVGQRVHILITGKSSGNKASTYLLPIQNIKITPGEASVYTVDSDSKIKKNPVVLGEVRGDFVEVKSGLSDDMKIVTPVYELEEGDKVVVQQ